MYERARTLSLLNDSQSRRSGSACSSDASTCDSSTDPLRKHATAQRNAAQRR